MPSSTSIPIIVQGNSFSLSIPLQVYVINEGAMVLQDYTPEPTDEVAVQLKSSRRSYSYTPTIDGNIANIDLSGTELADSYSVSVAIVKANGQRLRSYRTDQFFIVESSDDLTPADIIEGLEDNVIYLNAQVFVAGADGRGVVSIVKTATSGLVDIYTISYTDGTEYNFSVTNGTSEVADNLMTDDATKALSAYMGKLLSTAVFDDDASGDEALTKGSVWQTDSVVSVPDTMSTNADFGCLQLEVSAGDIIEINTKASFWHVTSYCITNRARTVLMSAPRIDDVTLATLLIAQDGYVFINCASDYYQDFKVARKIALVDELANELAGVESLLENVESLLEKRFSSNDLEPDDANGGYYDFGSLDVGGIAPETYTVNAGSPAWKCLRLAVNVGQKLTIATVGGRNARAYALTDTRRVILQLAPAPVSPATTYDTTSAPVVIDVPQKGYIYVNCKADSTSDFRVEVATNVYDALEAITAYIGVIDGALETLQETVETLSNGEYVINEYTSANLNSGQYWLIANNTFIDNHTYENAAWTCVNPIRVKRGDTFVISTKGGNNARAWAFTDTLRNILDTPPRATAGQDTIGNPITLTAQQEGYLYINCAANSVSGFLVQQIVNVVQSISDINEDIADIEGQIADIEVGNNPYAPHFKNNPLPLWKDTLKVLAIGNSYSEDMVTYLKDLVPASELDEDKLCVYMLIQSSASLQTWCENYASSTEKGMVRVIGNIAMGTESSSTPPTVTGTTKALLSKDWDVVIIQQVSTSAGDYSTFNPYLTQLIGYIRESCTNQQVAIAWQSVWSHNLSTEALTEKSWADICDATKQMMHNDGIDIIIPTGTAIQNARAYQKLHQTFNAGNTGAVTRDDIHLEFGVGRYIAACTFFQTLFAPMFGVSVLGNTSTHAITSGESESAQNVNGAVAVDSGNKSLCQLFAFAATINMWSVTNVTDATLAASTAPNTPTIYDRIADLESDKADNVTVVEVSGATPTQALAPNTFYKFTGSLTALTVTLGTPISGILNVYAFSFTAGAADVNVSLPQSVQCDDTLSNASGDYVEFSIVNNKATFKVWQAQSQNS